MSTLFPKPISYQYNIGGYNSDGIWLSGSDIENIFMGSVQPLTWKEVQSLNIGRKDTGKVKVYSDTQLPVSNEGGDIKGAVISWQNKKWELIDEASYQNDLINHYKYIGELRE